MMMTCGQVRAAPGQAGGEGRAAWTAVGVRARGPTAKARAAPIPGRRSAPDIRCGKGSDDERLLPSACSHITDSRPFRLNGGL
jgi:hypothetical protein